MDKDYFVEIGNELNSLQISQTQKAINIMIEVEKKLIEWDNPNKVDLHQLLHALNESIGLLPDYNKKWIKKTRYSQDDYKFFNYQISIVADRLESI